MLALVTLLGCGFAVGLIGTIAGLCRSSAPQRTLRVPVLSRGTLIRAAIAVACGAATGVLTRWPVGAVLAATAAYVLPIALGGGRQQKQALARTEAVAVWAEMLRDNLSAAAGLEQTILNTAPFAPPAIHADVNEVAAALRMGTRLPVALALLHDRIDDATGRLVTRALIQASQRQSRQLSELLSEMARRARQRAYLHLRIAPGHARIRTNARIIVGFTLAMATGLTVFNRTFLAPYDAPLGQLVLVVVGIMFGAGFLGITRLAGVGLAPGRPS